MATDNGESSEADHTVPLIYSSLLAAGAAAIYAAKTPWQSPMIKMLVIIIFGLAFVLNVIVPYLSYGVLNIPALVVYMAVFAYLFWLNVQAAVCTPPSIQR